MRARFLSIFLGSAALLFIVFLLVVIIPFAAKREDLLTLPAPIDVLTLHVHYRSQPTCPTPPRTIQAEPDGRYSRDWGETARYLTCLNDKGSLALVWEELWTAPPEEGGRVLAYRDVKTQPWHFITEGH